MNHPIVSVIIPMFNSQAFVTECIESILTQTMQSFELILIDDGSTDDTYEIARSYSEADSRITLLCQVNQGNALARENAMKIAKGDWLYFLDSDDIAEPTLLESAINRGTDTQADIVIFRTRTLNAITGELCSCPWAFDRKWIPGDVFSPRDFPDRLFNSFQNWVWNKLFRREFIRTSDIHFQSVHRTGDLFFTCSALALANRISLLDEELHRYRIANSSSTFQTSYAYPTDFFYAFKAAKELLDEKGLFELYRTSFINHALNGFVSNLKVANTEESFRAILECYSSSENDGAHILEIDSLKREEAYNQDNYNLASLLLSQDLSGFSKLFAFLNFTRNDFGEKQIYLSKLRQELTDARRQLECSDQQLSEIKDELARERASRKRANKALDALQASKSYRLGICLTYLPRKVLGLFRK